MRVVANRIGAFGRSSSEPVSLILHAALAFVHARIGFRPVQLYDANTVIRLAAWTTVPCWPAKGFSCFMDSRISIKMDGESRRTVLLTVRVSR